jgi:BTB/POZ domain-containing protein KCTD9
MKGGTTMNEKLMKYLDGVFAPYEDLKMVRELKEELFNNLQEKMSDLKDQGYDDETAYQMTIDSIGDISEIIENISAKTRELLELVQKDFSTMELRNSDLKEVRVPDGKFDYSDLKGTDFSGSDLTNCSFNCSNLNHVRFDGANLTGAKILMSALQGASFKNSILTNTYFHYAGLSGAIFESCTFEKTHFHYSDLSGLRFDHQTFIGTIFDKSALKGTSFKDAVFRNVSFKNVSNAKEAVFDGASMDKLTYAILKGYGANLTNVTVT